MIYRRFYLVILAILNFLYFFILTLNYLNKLPNFWNTNTIFYYVFILNLIFFYLDIKQNKERYLKNYKLNKTLTKIIILLGVFVSFLIIFRYNIFFIEKLYFVFIFLAFLIFFWSDEYGGENILNYKGKVVFKKLEIFIIFLIIASYILLGTYNLGKFGTTDEPRYVDFYDLEHKYPSSLEESTTKSFVRNFYDSSYTYWDSYLNGNIIGTLSSGASGTTINFILLPSFLFRNLEFTKYLFISRSVILFFNLLLILITFYFIALLFQKREAILFLSMSLLLPHIVGYNRIINHDSITGTLAILFSIMIFYSIRNKSTKIFYLSSIPYTFALATSGKASFLTPLLFILPVISFYITLEKKDLSFFKRNIGHFFVFCLITYILLLPASIIYPQILFTNLLMHKGIISISTILSIILLFNISKFDLSFIKDNEDKFVRGVMFFILTFFLVSIINTNLIVNNYLSNISDSFIITLLSSAIYLFYSLPVVVILIFFLKIVEKITYPKIDFSFIMILLFFILFLGAVYAGSTAEYGGSNVKSDVYNIFNTRYQLVIVYFLILGISNNRIINYFKKDFIFYFILITFIFYLIYSSYGIMPNYILYNNELFPEGYILNHNAWGLGSYEANYFLITHFSNSNLTCYDSTDLAKTFNTGEENITFTRWYNLEDYNESLNCLIYMYHAPGFIHRYEEDIEYYKGNWKSVWNLSINKKEMISIYLNESSLKE